MTRIHKRLSERRRGSGWRRRRRRYRVANTNKMPDHYRSFSAKKPYN